jgi:hypothetical protein
MPWQNEMVRTVRYLINDLDYTNFTYDNDRLEETIVVAAQLLQSMVDYYYSIYQVDVDTVSITPDPTNVNNGIKEDGFINLVSIQAALIVLGGELKASANSAIIVTDGPSTIDMREVLKNKKILYDDMKDRFNKAVYQYRAGNSIAGEAVLTPYTFNYLPAFYNPS